MARHYDLSVDEDGVVRAHPYGQVLGYVDTPEQFRQHQREIHARTKATATHAWTAMLQGVRVKASDDRDEVVRYVETEWFAMFWENGYTLRVYRRGESNR